MEINSYRWPRMMAWDDVGMAWDGVGMAWEDVGMAWDDVGMAWDDVGMAWDGVGMAWDDVGMAWDDVGTHVHTHTHTHTQPWFLPPASSCPPSAVSSSQGLWDWPETGPLPRLSFLLV